MKTIEDIDIKTELCNLSKILCDSLVDGRLCIAKLNHDCEKFKKAKNCRESLEKAIYVIFSKDMINYHAQEMFLFIDETGDIIDTVKGNEFWLYDMIEIYTSKEDIKDFHL